MSEYYDDVRKFAVEIARIEVTKHVREVGGENQGPEITKYKKAAHCSPTNDYGWCGMFVHWCYKQAADHYGLSLPFRPEALWRGNKLYNWTLSNPDSVVYTSPLQPGDIFVRAAGNMNHIGLVVEQMVDSNIMQTIEGNQSTAVKGTDSLTRRTSLFTDTAFIVRI